MNSYGDIRFQEVACFESTTTVHVSISTPSCRRLPVRIFSKPFPSGNATGYGFCRRQPSAIRHSPKARILGGGDHWIGSMRGRFPLSHEAPDYRSLARRRVFNTE